MAYKVREHSLPILPREADDICILHFSDLHLTPTRNWLIKDIQSWVNFKPDLIISTGDLIAHDDSITVLINSLGKLLEIPGFFVFGSNDYYAPKFRNPITYIIPRKGERKFGPELNWNFLNESLRKNGWESLIHQKKKIRINGVSIEARGTDDAHLGLDNYQLISGKPSDEIDLAIGVTHAPYKRVLAAMQQDNLQMIFAGHTHGGQIKIPWPGGGKALTTNCDLETWRASGLTKVNDEPWLNVSAGMGYNPFAPIRIACPPEISLITLTSKV